MTPLQQLLIGLLFTSTEVVYGVTGTGVPELPEYGVSPRLGVSTRRVEKLAASRGVTGLSKSQVSAMAAELDELAEGPGPGRRTAARTRSAGSTR